MRSISTRTGDVLLTGTLIALVAVLYLPWLGHLDLLHEETRRAVIARTMMETGDYLVPHLAEQVYLAKPPLFNWMIAAASWPAGTVTEFTARLPSVVSLGLLAALMVWTAGRRLALPGRWLLGLSIILTGEIVNKTVLAEIELAFTLLVSASLWAWFELDERGKRGLSLWLLPAILVATAFLTKREPALVFFYLGIGGYLIIQHRLRELFSPAHLYSAAVIVALITAWLAPIVHRVGVSSVIENTREEVLTRGLSPSVSEYAHHIMTYPFEVLGAALPFSLLLLPLAWRSTRIAVKERYGRALTFSVIVVLINLPIYWLRADASVRYFLPMFPTLLVIAAMVFDTFSARAAELSRGASRAFSGVGWTLLGLASALAAIAVAASIPGLFRDIAGPLFPAGLVIGGGILALGGAIYLAVNYPRQATVIALAGAIGFGILFRLIQLNFVVPHEARKIAQQEDVPAILETIRRELPEGTEHVQALGKLPHAIWFYDREDTVVPYSRYQREGSPASPYVLLWLGDGRSMDDYGTPITQIRRLDYEDGDFVLGRALPSTDG